MDRKKIIAIATFAYSDRNYGQILQAFALQKYLENCGCEAYIIDYTPNCLEYYLGPRESIQRIKYFIKNIPFLKSYFLHRGEKYINYKNHDRHFKDFKRKHLQFSNIKYTQIKELIDNPPKADFYITGSDQVWGRSVPNPYPYLLQFVDTPNKLSYAASFGRSQLEDFEIPVFKQELMKYKKIGVREVSGVSICERMNITNSQFTPDPTILLLPEEWKRLLSTEKLFKTKKKKIFIYSCYLRREELIGRFVGLDDYEIIIEDVINNDKDIAMLSLENWIKAISEADYVITNSFHATMFSLYMNTPFITFQYANKGKAMNTRLNSILDQLDLTYRFVHLNTNLDMVFDILNKQIEWNTINAQLDKIRQIGYDFINEGLR